jgi:hypothetical protein
MHHGLIKLVLVVDLHTRDNDIQDMIHLPQYHCSKTKVTTFGHNVIRNVTLII